MSRLQPIELARHAPAGDVGEGQLGSGLRAQRIPPCQAVLRIDVEQRDLARRRQGGADVGGKRRLACPAFLLGDCNDDRHGA
jgi:hypothetical protein